MKKILNRINQLASPVLFVAIAFAYFRPLVARSDSAFIYWSTVATTGPNTSDSKIKRANLDGTAVQTIMSNPASGRFGGIAFDPSNQQLYTGDRQNLYRANLDGSGRTIIVSNTSVTDVEIDLHRRRIYWSDSVNLYAANLDGTGNSRIVTGISIDLVEGIAVEPLSGRVYYAWNEPGGLHQIRSVNRDGSGLMTNVVRSFSGQVFDDEVAPNEGMLYWNEPGATPQLRRTRLDGTSSVELLFAPTNGLGNGMFYDEAARKVYWLGLSTNLVPSDIYRGNTDGSQAEFLVHEPDQLNYLEILRLNPDADFTDNFEAATLNPFWGKTEINGVVKVSSTNLVHGGTQSLLLQTTNPYAQGQWASIQHTFTAPIYGSFSVWVYDTMVLATFSDYLTFEVQNSGTGEQALIFTQNYDQGVGGFGHNYFCESAGVQSRTSIARSSAWHHWVIAALPNSLTLSIDGSVVYQGAGGVSFDTVTISLSGGTHPSFFVPVDDFEFRQITPIGGYVDPYVADADTVLLDHFDGTTAGTLKAFNFNAQPCGSPMPDGTPNYSFDSGPAGLSQCLTLITPTNVSARSGSYVEYPGGQILSMPNGTIEFWVNPSRWNTPLANQGPYPYSCAGWTFLMDINPEGTLEGSFWPPLDFNSGQTVVPTNAWSHVALTWGSAGAKLYLNGRIVGTNSGTGMPASGFGGSLRIYGTSDTNATVKFDELRISSIARTNFNLLKRLAVTNITVAPTNPITSTLQSLQFTATGTFSDGATRPLSGSVLWTSGNTNVASISTEGLVHPLTQGYTTITACQDNICASTTLFVTNQPPTIAKPPVNQSVGSGSAVQWCIAITGSQPLSYQWRFNGTNISGATSGCLTVTNASLANAGLYSLVVANPFGTNTVQAALSLVDLKVFAGLIIAGPAGHYRIDAQESLGGTNIWTILGTNVVDHSPYYYFDTNSPSHPSRFYRAIWMP